METLEQFLVEDEEHLFSYSMPELEKIVQLFSDEVQSNREQLSKTKAELRDLEIETSERNSSREFYVSLLAQAMDLKEALEEEAETQQQLKAVTGEVKRLTDTPPAEISEVLETQLMEAEGIMAAFCRKERELVEEMENLKTMLQKSQAGLAQTRLEHQRVEEELLALENNPPAHRFPGSSEANLLLDACIKEIGALGILPDEKRRKK
ncbi:uncharacterized protein LOC142098336 isoform X2 [Mixophyes fleayi]